MPETVNPADRQTLPERVKFHSGLVGLQTRLLIGGEALNPNKTDLPSVTAESLGNLQSRNYSPFAAASLRERKNYWQGKEDDHFSRQKEVWLANFVSLFDQNKYFFRQNEEGKSWSELFAKLAINPLSFSRQSADEFYNRYFTGENKDSNIKLFVQDILSAYASSDGKIDYSRLRKDLDGVQWLANVFGSLSSEIVSQLADAESKLQTQPENLINQANTKEIELLEFIYSKKLIEFEPSVIIPQAKLPQNYNWKYERPKEPRKFPEKSLLGIVNNITNPEYVAKLIKEYRPDINEEAVLNQIKREQKELDNFLEIAGLKQPELRKILEEVLSNYKSFLKQKYKINLPSVDLNDISIKPVHGIMTQVINPHALGYVFAVSPTIYLNFDEIYKQAAKLAESEWSIFTTDHIVRLLNEIKPHEFTHLSLDLAYWYLVKNGQVKQGDPVRVTPGKVGLEVIKPTPPYLTEDLDIITKARGGPLMEAVTVELTDQWAGEVHHQPLDLPAYEKEREVLHALINQIADEQNISFDDSFRKFVLASSSAQGYYDLVYELSGKKIIRDKNGKLVSKEGEIKRPYYLEIIYALMEVDQRNLMQKIQLGINPKNIHYDLTLGYINKVYVSINGSVNDKFCFLNYPIIS